MEHYKRANQIKRCSIVFELGSSSFVNCDTQYHDQVRFVLTLFSSQSKVPHVHSFPSKDSSSKFPIFHMKNPTRHFWRATLQLISFQANRYFRAPETDVIAPSGVYVTSVASLSLLCHGLLGAQVCCAYAPQRIYLPPLIK